MGANFHKFCVSLIILVKRAFWAAWFGYPNRNSVLSPIDIGTLERDLPDWDDGKGGPPKKFGFFFIPRAGKGTGGSKSTSFIGTGIDQDQGSENGRAIEWILGNDGEDCDSVCTRENKGTCQIETLKTFVQSLRGGKPDGYKFANFLTSNQKLVNALNVKGLTKNACSKIQNCSCTGSGGSGRFQPSILLSTKNCAFFNDSPEQLSEIKCGAKPVGGFRRLCPCGTGSATGAGGGSTSSGSTSGPSGGGATVSAKPTSGAKVSPELGSAFTLYQGWAKLIHPRYNNGIITAYKKGEWDSTCGGFPPCQTQIYIYRDPIIVSVPSTGNMMYCDDGTQARIGPYIKGPLDQDKYAIRMGGRLPIKQEVLRWGDEMEGQLITLLGGSLWVFVPSSEKGGYDAITTRGTAEPPATQAWSGIVKTAGNPFAQMHYVTGSCETDKSQGTVKRCNGLDDLAPPTVICGLSEPTGVACGENGEVAIVDPYTRVATIDEAEIAAAKTGGRLPTYSEAQEFYGSVYVSSGDFFILNPELEKNGMTFEGQKIFGPKGPLGYRDMIIAGAREPELWSDRVAESKGKDAQMDSRNCNGSKGTDCKTMKKNGKITTINAKLDSGGLKTLVYCAIPCGEKQHAMIVRYKTGMMAIASGVKVALEMARKNSPAPQAGRLPFLSEVRLWPKNAIELMKKNAFALPPYNGKIPASMITRAKNKYTQLCIHVRCTSKPGGVNQIENGLYTAVKGSTQAGQPWFITTDIHEKADNQYRTLRRIKNYNGIPAVWMFNKGTDPRGKDGTCFSRAADKVQEFLTAMNPNGKSSFKIGKQISFQFECGQVLKTFIFQYVQPSRCGSEAGPWMTVLNDAAYGRSDYIAQDKHGGFLFPGQAGFDVISYSDLGDGLESTIEGKETGKQGYRLKEKSEEKFAPNPTDMGRVNTKKMLKSVTWVGVVKKHNWRMLQSAWDPKCVGKYARKKVDNCFSFDDVKTEVIACRPNGDVRAPPSSKVGHKGPPLPKLNICGWKCMQGRSIDRKKKQGQNKVWQKMKEYTSVEDMFMDKRDTGRFSEVAVTYDHKKKVVAAWAASNPPIDLYAGGSKIRADKPYWSDLTIEGTEDQEVCIKPTFTSVSGYIAEGKMVNQKYNNLADAIRDCGSEWAGSKSCAFITYSVESKTFQRYDGSKIVKDAEGYFILNGNKEFQKKGLNTVLYGIGPHGLRMRKNIGSDIVKSSKFQSTDLINDFTAPAPFGATESCALLKAYHATDLDTGRWTFEGSSRFAASLGGRLPTVEELRQFDTFSHPVYQERKEIAAKNGANIWIPAYNKRANPGGNGGSGAKDWVYFGAQTLKSRKMFSFRERFECPMWHGNTMTSIGAKQIGKCNYKKPTEEKGYCTGSYPLDDPITEQPWWIPRNQPLNGPPYCPKSCQRCKSGPKSDNGTDVFPGGCYDWCSTGGFCGTGEAYQKGSDCHGCTLPSCPAQCGRAKNGPAKDGGQEVKDGFCQHIVIDKTGWCGDGENYKLELKANRALSCSGCKIKPSKKSIGENAGDGKKKELTNYCKLVCSKNPECGGFAITFSDNKEMSCQLYNLNRCRKPADRAPAKYFYHSCVREALGALVPGFFFDDGSRAAKTAWHCARKCGEMKKCQHWTSHPIKLRCWLKADQLELAKKDPIDADTMYVGSSCSVDETKPYFEKLGKPSTPKQSETNGKDDKCLGLPKADLGLGYYFDWSKNECSTIKRTAFEKIKTAAKDEKGKWKDPLCASGCRTSIPGWDAYPIWGDDGMDPLWSQAFNEEGPKKSWTTFVCLGQDNWQADYYTAGNGPAECSRLKPYKVPMRITFARAQAFLKARGGRLPKVKEVRNKFKKAAKTVMTTIGKLTKPIWIPATLGQGGGPNDKDWLKVGENQFGTISHVNDQGGYPVWGDDPFNSFWNTLSSDPYYPDNWYILGCFGSGDPSDPHTATCQKSQNRGKISELLFEALITTTTSTTTTSTTTTTHGNAKKVPNDIYDLICDLSGCGANCGKKDADTKKRDKMSPPIWRIKNRADDIIRANRYFFYPGDQWVSFCPVGTENCCKQACGISVGCEYYREFGPITQPYAKVIKCEFWGENDCINPNTSPTAPPINNPFSSSATSLIQQNSMNPTDDDDDSNGTALVQSSRQKRGLIGAIGPVLPSKWKAGIPYPTPAQMVCDPSSSTKEYMYILGNVKVTGPKEADETAQILYGRLAKLSEGAKWNAQSLRWIPLWSMSAWAFAKNEKDDSYDMTSTKGDWAPPNGDSWKDFCKYNQAAKYEDMYKKRQMLLYCATFGQAQMPCNKDEGSMLTVDPQNVVLGPQQAVNKAARTGGRIPTMTEIRRWPSELPGPGDIMGIGKKRTGDATGWTIVKLDPQSLSCPSACQSCKSGQNNDGGLATVGGKCLQFCSANGFCGISLKYRKGGTDCIGCSSAKCPGECSVCRAGTGQTNGVALAGSGKCEKYCSWEGICGDGGDFTLDGTDCTGCSGSSSLLEEGTSEEDLNDLNDENTWLEENHAEGLYDYTDYEALNAGRKGKSRQELYGDDEDYIYNSQRRKTSMIEQTVDGEEMAGESDFNLEDLDSLDEEEEQSLMEQALKKPQRRSKDKDHGLITMQDRKEMEEAWNNPGTVDENEYNSKKKKNDSENNNNNDDDDDDENNDSEKNNETSGEMLDKSSSEDSDKEPSSKDSDTEQDENDQETNDIESSLLEAGEGRSQSWPGLCVDASGKELQRTGTGVGKADWYCEIFGKSKGAGATAFDRNAPVSSKCIYYKAGVGAAKGDGNAAYKCYSFVPTVPPVPPFKWLDQGDGLCEMGTGYMGRFEQFETKGDYDKTLEKCKAECRKCSTTDCKGGDTDANKGKCVALAVGKTGTTVADQCLMFSKCDTLDQTKANYKTFKLDKSKPVAGATSVKPTITKARQVWDTRKPTGPKKMECTKICPKKGRCDACDTTDGILKGACCRVNEDKNGVRTHQKDDPTECKLLDPKTSFPGANYHACVPFAGKVGGSGFNAKLVGKFDAVRFIGGTVIRRGATNLGKLKALTTYCAIPCSAPFSHVALGMSIDRKFVTTVDSPQQAENLADSDYNARLPKTEEWQRILKKPGSEKEIMIKLGQWSSAVFGNLPANLAPTSASATLAPNVLDFA